MSTALRSAVATHASSRIVVRIAAFLLLGAMGASLAFGASLEEIKKRGYMVVATEDDYPPFEYVVNGKPVGYDHALLALLRKSAGFEIRQEILPWQGILPGVASGKYDAAVTAAVITDERVKSLDFTMPISESTMAYVKRKGDSRIQSIKDLSGMTLGVQQGGASFQVLPELEASAQGQRRQAGADRSVRLVLRSLSGSPQQAPRCGHPQHRVAVDPGQREAAAVRTGPARRPKVLRGLGSPEG